MYISYFFDVVENKNQDLVKTKLILITFCSFSSSSMDFTDQRPATTSSAKRLYIKPGMVPKYTGYLPRKHIISSFS
jgi:hypothetical protein